MRKSLLLSVFGLTLTLAVASPVLAASANYVAAVRANCQQLQTTLDELQRRDLVARINRGRAYQDVLDQMQAFNTRMRNSSLSPTEFEARYNKASSAVDAFRTAYVHYDDLMSNLRQTSCTDKTDDFITLLGQVRDARAQTGDAITNIEGELADYRQLASALQLQLAQPGGIR